MEKLLESGINKDQIFAFDVNPNFKPEIEKLGVNFTTQDTLLSIYPDSYNEFDFIIGNPPYLNKASAYVRENKKKLKQIYGKINAHETYAMFIVNGIWRLKEGGKLGFITSDSFLTLITHKKLRRFILKNCVINEILLAPRDLFSNQKVSTSPVIFILTKCSGQKNQKTRYRNVMKIIPRINSEDNYDNPDKIIQIEQRKYNSLPANIFFTDVHDQIIELFEKAPKIKEYIKGFIGMHTHNNRKYIGAVEDTKLAEIFRKRNEKNIEPNRRYKIISREEFDSTKWKPYLKRGGADQYYRPIMEALDWNEDSIKNYDIPVNVPFEKEGIIISGVSSRLAARYMPRGCYWDSNKAIGFIIKEEIISIPYILGLLNSSLYNYLAKGIINNTSSIQITGIQSLPIIIPDKQTKERIEELVKMIIASKKNDENYNYKMEQKKIDEVIFNFYSNRIHIPLSLKQKLDEFYANY